jgi:hypothetical protein
MTVYAKSLPRLQQLKTVWREQKPGANVRAGANGWSALDRPSLSGKRNHDKIADRSEPRLPQPWVKLISFIAPVLSSMTIVCQPGVQYFPR